MHLIKRFTINTTRGGFTLDYLHDSVYTGYIDGVCVIAEDELCYFKLKEDPLKHNETLLLKCTYAMGDILSVIEKDSGLNQQSRNTLLKVMKDLLDMVEEIVK